MSIEFSGNGNRVAGHTYNENLTLTLTAEQAQLLALKACSLCAQRFVNSGETVCVVCNREQATRRELQQQVQAREHLKNKLSFFACVALLVWGGLLGAVDAPIEYRTPGRMFELLLGAVGITLLAAGLLSWFRHWWLWNGDEVKAALSRRVATGVKRFFM